MSSQTSSPDAAGRRLGPSSRAAVIGIAAVAAGMAAWELAARLLASPVQLPAPSAIAAHGAAALWGGEELLGATIPEHLLASLRRIGAGYLLGSLLGAALGFLMGASAFIHRFLDPVVNFVRFIPPIAWISPFLIWFGIGELSKVALIVYTVAFMVLLSTLAGVRAVAREQLRAAESMGAGQWQRFRWVVFPASLPHVLGGMRIAIGNAFVTIVAAEMIAAQSGLGYLILVSRNFGGTDIVFLMMALLGVLGFGADRLFVCLTAKYARRFHRG